MKLFSFAPVLGLTALVPLLGAQPESPAPAAPGAQADRPLATTPFSDCEACEAAGSTCAPCALAEAREAIAAFRGEGAGAPAPAPVAAQQADVSVEFVRAQADEQADAAKAAARKLEQAARKQEQAARKQEQAARKLERKLARAEQDTARLHADRERAQAHARQAAQEALHASELAKLQALGYLESQDSAQSELEQLEQRLAELEQELAHREQGTAQADYRQAVDALRRIEGAEYAQLDTAQLEDSDTWAEAFEESMEVWGEEFEDSMEEWEFEFEDSMEEYEAELEAWEDELEAWEFEFESGASERGLENVGVDAWAFEDGGEAFTITIGSDGQIEHHAAQDHAEDANLWVSGDAAITVGGGSGGLWVTGDGDAPKVKGKAKGKSKNKDGKQKQRLLWRVGGDEHDEDANVFVLDGEDAPQATWFSEDEDGERALLFLHEDGDDNQIRVEVKKLKLALEQAQSGHEQRALLEHLHERVGEHAPEVRVRTRSDQDLHSSIGGVRTIRIGDGDNVQVIELDEGEGGRFQVERILQGQSGQGAKRGTIFVDVDADGTDERYLHEAPHGQHEFELEEYLSGEHGETLRWFDKTDAHDDDAHHDDVHHEVEVHVRGLHGDEDHDVWRGIATSPTLPRHVTKKVIVTTPDGEFPGLSRSIAVGGENVDMKRVIEQVLKTRGTADGPHQIRIEVEGLNLPDTPGSARVGEPRQPRTPRAPRAPRALSASPSTPGAPHLEVRRSAPFPGVRPDARAGREEAEELHEVLRDMRREVHDLSRELRDLRRQVDKLDRDGIR